jgi:hypothetical protein
MGRLLSWDAFSSFAGFWVLGWLSSRASLRAYEMKRQRNPEGPETELDQKELGKMRMRSANWGGWICGIVGLLAYLDQYLRPK